MRLKIPNPSDEPVLPDLKKFFDEEGVQWQKPSSKRPDLPNLCPPATDNKKKTLPPKKSHLGKHQPLPPPPPIADRWLTIKFNRMMLDLAIHLNLNQQAKAALVQALVDANLQVPTISTATRALTPVQSKTPGGGKRITGQIESSEIERREACEIISNYLEPLLDADNFSLWLTEMARSQWSWRGGDPKSPSVPHPVRHREAARDRQLLIDWFASPQAPKRSPSELGRAEALIESEPTAPGQLAPLGGTTPVLPLVVIKGQPVPANLFISDVSIPLTGYLTLLDLVLRAGASVLDLHIPLLGVAYGMLALALVPVYCLYDNFHGTCTIEMLIPKLRQSIVALREYPNKFLEKALSPGLNRKLLMVEDPYEASALQVEKHFVLDAFTSWAKSLADAIERSHQTLLFVAGEQSGGRVRTPVQLTSNREWLFNIKEKQPDGTLKEVEYKAQELIGYEQDLVTGISKREIDKEIFWILQAIWKPLATAVALVNQSGMRFWFNAANNRWGGHHPPHISHRQGNSIDFDIGFGWLPLYVKDPVSGQLVPSKVPDVKKRNKQGFPLTDQEYKGNSAKPSCLTGMNRIAGLIGIQAFIICGVTQYLYGDTWLVEIAGKLIAAHFGNKIRRPGQLDGTVEWKKHFNHWHFEMLVGPRPAGVDPYEWQVNDKSLLDQLQEQAETRDNDPVFWKKMAGLDKVPTDPSDFNKLSDGDHWKQWWQRRDGEAGIPLLPLWVSSEAAWKFGAQDCWDPKIDLPGLFEPGEIGA